MSTCTSANAAEQTSSTLKEVTEIISAAVSFLGPRDHRFNKTVSDGVVDRIWEQHAFGEGLYCEGGNSRNVFSEEVTRPDHSPTLIKHA